MYMSYIKGKLCVLTNVQYILVDYLGRSETNKSNSLSLVKSIKVQKSNISWKKERGLVVERMVNSEWIGGMIQSQFIISVYKNLIVKTHYFVQ